MTHTNKTLVDWLDDLCVRFIVNLPNEELQSVERICFQIEEAQWFYEDFIRPLDPSNLPSMHLRKFSQLMFQHCPLFSAYSEELHQQAYEQFLAYKTRVPVRGAIMLNEDMTHAVLVKGWKKGAKWSFPRGKINKEETDLDCAVREVWEETGYDLRKADLVEPDEYMKKITVTMREQSMMLYVFRGVPMDTRFEPQTRKEISKIDWYKLTELPTLRRKNQVQQQQQQQQPQGHGQDLIKESSFYMVAPFLGPLKQWIKQQNKLGRQRQRNSAHVAHAPVAGTDDEDIHATLYESTADEATMNTQPNNNFANMVAQLGRNHHPSDSLPELHASSQQSQDPAEALKRLLSVGMQSSPVEAPSNPPPNQPQANPLLALFKQGNSQPGGQQPRTPFEQIMSPPVQPSSPHGQHHPRPPQMGSMGPPPPFFPPRGPPGHLNGMQHPPHMPPHFMHHPPQHPPQHPGAMFAPQPPTMQHAFDQRNSQHFQEMGDSQFAGGNGRPAIPAASKLPAPNLNSHAMGLLNSFRSNNQQSPVPPSPQTTIAAPLHRSLQTTPKIEHPLPQHLPHGLVSPQGQFASSPPQFHSPLVSSSFVPEQPKPRNMHQDSLLSLFRPTPPMESPQPGPAELSALPTTPAYPPAQPVANPPEVPNQTLHGVHGALPTRTKITSATVSGPVNAPDFETMKKHRQPTSGSSRGVSPAANMPFMPQQILKRAPQASPQNVAKVSQSPQPAAEVAASPQPFKPQILKRPQQQEPKQAQSPLNGKTIPGQAHAQGLLDMFKGPSPQPPPAQPALPSRSPQPPPLSAMDRRESVPSDQKNVLLSLFGNKPTPSPKPQTQSPVPPARSPFPPTPKTSMSGVVSPISPFPPNGSVGATSPEGMANRSRISSIGDGSGPSIVIPPPTSHPVDAGVGLSQTEGVSLGGLGNPVRTGSTSEGKSPVDKSFLLGFLRDVAERGR
ncbi:decapping protein box a [Stemphylium lycopersici]|uniref:Mrna decapping protein box a n=1 Tax=Stemphylium lycopersici TaxID=183478 RepID=A0A364N0D4_STELY|nr:decapping protein box a [Stemphylium lycopersici]RAR08677.1 mrna decapping protein box a [Stemphylium lycopersici]